jgi:hypothetical protein
MVCNSCGSHDVKATQIADPPSLTDRRVIDQIRSNECQIVEIS